MHYTLRIDRFFSALEWDWSLFDENNTRIVRHCVRIDPAEFEFSLFADLPYNLQQVACAYANYNDAVDELLPQLGLWINRVLFGSILEWLIQHRGTIATVVLVEIPSAAKKVGSYPFEFATWENKLLIEVGIVLVYAVEGTSTRELSRAPASKPLRFLSLFSSPANVSALALRKERKDLASMVAKLTTIHRLDIELMILQYGATKETLSRIVEDANGWDILHISAHGEENRILLENEFGRGEDVDDDELVSIIRPLAGRVRLVTVHSCLSAATYGPSSATEPESLAFKIAARLDCAVLGMRYSVRDAFAAALTTELYRCLLEQRQSLTNALALKLRLGGTATALSTADTISKATPILLHTSATNLTLLPPKSKRGQLELPAVGLASFPPEPSIFVGRVDLLSMATAAFAPAAKYSVVIFHGLPGIGKSEAALELIYRHQRQRFSKYVYYDFLSGGGDAEVHLQSFVTALELQLELFEGTLTGAFSSDASSTLELRIKSFLYEQSVVLLLDNLEVLLDSVGNWILPEWKRFFNMLALHGGLSRTVVTSRFAPVLTQKVSERCLLLPLTPLSPDEVDHLIDELPDLRQLRRSEADNEILSLLRNWAGGVPALIVQAEAIAGDAPALAQFCAELVNNGSKSTHEEPIAQWVRTLIKEFSSEQRQMLIVVAGLAPLDRVSDLVIAVSSPNANMTPINYNICATQIVHFLAAKALFSLRESADGFQVFMHPAVAESCLALVDKSTRDTIEQRALLFLKARASDEFEKQRQYSKACSTVMRAVPYAIRLGQVDHALNLIKIVINIGNKHIWLQWCIAVLRFVQSRTTGKARLQALLLELQARVAAGDVRNALPIIRRIKPHEEGLDAAEIIRLKHSEIECLLAVGKSEDALAVAISVTKLPSTEENASDVLAIKCAECRVQVAVGKAVIAESEIRRLLKDDSELFKKHPNLHLNALNVLFSACVALGKWKAALTAIEEMQELFALTAFIKREPISLQLDKAGILIKLGRTDEAKLLIEQCQVAVESAKYPQQTYQFHSRASEMHFMARDYVRAELHAKAALRVAYALLLPEACASAHFNYAIVARAMQRELTAAVHVLCSGLISVRSNLKEFSRFLVMRLEHLGIDQITVREINHELSKLSGISIDLLIGPDMDRRLQAVHEEVRKWETQVVLLSFCAEAANLIPETTRDERVELRRKLLHHLPGNGAVLYTMFEQIWRGARSLEQLTVALDPQMQFLAGLILKMIDGDHVEFVYGPASFRLENGRWVFNPT